MTLPTGAISFSNLNTELGRPATQAISLNDSAVRSLAGKPSGLISMSDLRGKSAVTVSISGFLGEMPTGVGGPSQVSGVFNIHSSGGTPTAYSWGFYNDTGYAIYHSGSTTGPQYQLYGPTYDPFAPTVTHSVVVTCTVTINGQNYAVESFQQYTSNSL